MSDALAQLGLEEDQVLEAARLMPPAELERLAFTLDRILESLRPAKPHLLEAKGLPGALATAKKRYLEDFKGLLGELQQGEIDQKEFARQARPLISDAFGKAYEIGVKRPLDDGDEEWLRRSVDSEVGYAVGLAKDVSQGNVQDVAFRANNYAASLDGVAWNGMVESLPEDSVIHWKLGQAEHCDDCILLACFLKNHLTITTSHGKIPLSEVRVGDLVLTHEGRFRQVLAKPVKPSAAGKRCAVLCTEEGLVGLTADHRLWTARGWITAEEAFHARERCLPGLRGGDRSPGDQVQELRRVPAGRAQDVRESEGNGLQVHFDEEPVGRDLLCVRDKEDGVAPPLALGDGAREGSVELPRASQERGFVGRPAGEPGAEDAERASLGSHEAGEESVLEGGPAGGGRLQVVRKRIQSVDVEPEGVLLEGMRSEGADAAGHADLDVRQLREGVRAASVHVEPAGKEAAVLLSRMLSGAQVGEAEGEDPAVCLLREYLRDGEVEDQELQVGQVLLLPGVLPEGSLLYDLTVEEDHSFVAAGLVVHNSHSPYDKYSLPTTPRSGDTSCRMNCKCKIVIEPPSGEQPETGVFGIPGQLGDELPRPTQGQSLVDWLRPPEPPEGLSTPEGKDRLAVDALQGEVNYWRRAISQIDETAEPEEFLTAVEARKAANSKLIDYLEERNLWDAPLLSVDEVITGRDISLLAERGLFELSVSGDALTETAEREVLRLIEKYELGIGKKY